ncbi:MAG: hypothetical protein Q9201_007624, partial [Fulgogasparrea decipioides]
MAQIVYTGVTDTAGIQGQLFEGIRFWLSQKVPQRKRFIDEVKANGGDITPLEKDADIKIVDHTRKEQIPDTYSYQFIEFSVRNGTLEDLKQHAVGPPAGAIRTAGSTIQPSKSSRTKFTDEDDRLLANWIVGTERSGGATSGNEIYKQLEAKNSRHTWQSWRDHWLKTLRYLPRSASIFQDAPPTPPTEEMTETERRSTLPKPKTARPKPFTKDDAEALISTGEYILELLPEDIEAAWSAWASQQD